MKRTRWPVVSWIPALLFMLLLAISSPGCTRQGMTIQDLRLPVPPAVAVLGDGETLAPHPYVLVIGAQFVLRPVAVEAVNPVTSAAVQLTDNLVPVGGGSGELVDQSEGQRRAQADIIQNQQAKSPPGDTPTGATSAADLQNPSPADAKTVSKEIPAAPGGD
ncbi:MAG: hypothetical protein HN849_28030 [Victivallales bacterium]|jgi:hypothetical protein|nr:hypothetical protein [Victivallales bacterium]MBT7303411.1 hypothetical protein [Victivallales bacterium]